MSRKSIVPVLRVSPRRARIGSRIYYVLRLRGLYQYGMGSPVGKAHRDRPERSRYGRARCDEQSGQRRTDKLARELQPNEIWNLLGGLDGVKSWSRNSRVLVEMAGYLQRSYPEAACSSRRVAVASQRAGVASEQTADGG